MTLFSIASPGPTLTDISLSTFGLPVVRNLNEIIFDLTPALSTWTRYTPLWVSSGTQPVLNNGLLDARFMRIGQMGYVEVKLAFGTLTTPGTGFYTWTLPPSWNVATAGTSFNTVVGAAYVIDAVPGVIYVGVTNVGVTNIATGENAFTLSTHEAATAVGQGVPVGLSSLDVIAFNAAVELA